MLLSGNIITESGGSFYKKQRFFFIFKTTLFTIRFMQMKKLIAFPLIILFVISIHNLNAQSEEEMVIQTIQKFFDAMETKDTTSAKKILLPEGQIFSIRGDSSDLYIRLTSNKEYTKNLGQTKDDYLEKMRAPIIHIHGRIAVVWTTYDFFRNGEFSHTGIDAFSLIKTEEGWKIAGTVYTVEPKDHSE